MHVNIFCYTQIMIFKKASYDPFKCAAILLLNYLRDNSSLCNHKHFLNVCKNSWEQHLTLLCAFQKHCIKCKYFTHTIHHNRSDLSHCAYWVLKYYGYPCHLQFLLLLSCFSSTWARHIHQSSLVDPEAHRRVSYWLEKRKWWDSAKNKVHQTTLI